MDSVRMLSVAPPSCYSKAFLLPQPHSPFPSSSTICRTKFLKLESCNILRNTSSLRLRWTKPRCVELRRRPIVMILPTAKPERASAENLPKWSARAIKSYSLAKQEARKMKYPKIGTELLLMGMLVEGTSSAAKFLRANGVTVFNLRDEIIKLLGKSDHKFPPLENMPPTEPAVKALDWAVDEKIKSGETGEVTTTHMLLGIWAQKGFAGHLILSSLGFDEKKFEELAKSIKEVVLSSK